MSEKEQGQIKMFGQTVEELKAEWEEVKGLYSYLGPAARLMYATSILSDAQEVLERGDKELARQLINKAKWFTVETMDAIKPPRE